MKNLGIAVFLLAALASQTLAFEMSSRWLQADATPVTASPLAPGPHPLGTLKPWLECISKAPGTITAYFGFNNPTTDNIGVPVGANNKFVPDPANRSQTTNFLPGRSRYFPVYAFSINIGSNAQASWQLNGYEVTADANSAQCETRFVAFQMVVDAPPPLTGPTTSQVASMATSAATQMGADESQIKTEVNNVGLGKYQIVFNVSQVEAGATTGVDPVLGVTILFGDNNKFTAFVDQAIAVGLAPSLVEPLPTGKEVEGVPIGSSTPSSTSPSSPSSPSSSPSSSSPSSSPSSPSSSPPSPSSGFPSSPSSITPSGTASPTPTSGAVRTRVPGETIIFLLVATLSFVVIYASCI